MADDVMMGSEIGAHRERKNKARLPAANPKHRSISLWSAGGKRKAVMSEQYPSCVRLEKRKILRI